MASGTVAAIPSIKDFFHGKTLFVTGSSGFIGKVLVEKLLREQADIARVYVLLRCAKDKTAQQRLKDEFIDSELFKEIHRTHKAGYEAFLSEKVIPVSGDVAQPRLGIPQEMFSRITGEVQVVLHLAANVNFRLPLEAAVQENVLGALEVARMAAVCTRLEAYVHYSTAFAHGERVGYMEEVPLSWSRFEEGFRTHSCGVLSSTDKVIAAWISETSGSPAAEVSWALSMPDKVDAHLRETMGRKAANADAFKRAKRRLLKELALQRGRLYGQQDGYSYSKALAEMVVQEHATQHELPLVILRPAIVGTVASGPHRGWVEFVAETSPMLIGYFTGDIGGFFSNNRMPLDLVPCDHVVNASLAAAVRHARHRGTISVYQVASSVENPFQYAHLEVAAPAYARLQYPERQLPDFPIYDTVDKYMDMLRARYPSKISTSDKLFAALSPSFKARLIHGYTKFRTYEYMAALYKVYMLTDSYFHATRTAELFHMMSADDQHDFDFDVKGIDWHEYLMGSHLPGVCRHLLGADVVILPTGHAVPQPSTTSAKDAASPAKASPASWRVLRSTSHCAYLSTMLVVAVSMAAVTVLSH